jgi:hypothetical protein
VYDVKPKGKFDSVCMFGSERIIECGRVAGRGWSQFKFLNEYKPQSV